MTWFEAIGWLGAVLAVTGSAMRTIIPLRCIGIGANICSLIFSSFTGNYPSLVVNLILLPLNGMRLYQMLGLIKRVKQASRSDLSMDWLKPFMTRHKTRTGELLFAKGDVADCMFFTISGRYRLKEIDIELLQGQVVGEMGFMSPSNTRTQTLECLEAGEVLSISYDEVRQLYFQNPEFGFYFLRLASERLFSNMEKMEEEIVRLRAALPDIEPIQKAASA
ncbi:MAG: Crp/Fnr family transcriptional regulator [Microvirga sp.]|jgi:CRP/FNR family cyclic AMP-dependent transcriptional regulator|uniref:Crp/Fnr family transcriptional regulator n=1 Tax=Microvirga tunisiensis TaxID=2108360 RepID=A0A5N7MQB6_9HYPH|nr:Crp/Fnr family transcriptional regulator [Microvirga tunisiensis]MPR07781.1 Crp/Fnr family transcriptional regulator [Microvirga tunisiensis]MPR26176.1 Crp/Fnr family transcriptional regulator [Microvirga tunisiensis]